MIGKMMRKNDLCALLCAYYDGQLEEEDAVIFSEHLQQCSACLKKIGEFNTLSSFLKVTQESVSDMTLFDTVWSRVEKKLVQEDLSFVDVGSNQQRTVLVPLRNMLMPLIAASFIFFILMRPMLVRDHKVGIESIVLPVEETVCVNKISAHARTVVLMRTQKQQWPVIWLLPHAEKRSNADMPTDKGDNYLDEGGV